MAIARDPVPKARSWARLTAWLERAFQAVDDWTQLAQELFSVGAYASVSAEDAADADIGAAWQPVDFFSVELVSPRGVVMGLDGVFSFPYFGVYQIALTGTVTHNEVNAGRHFNIRLWSITQGAAVGPVFYIPTGRNSPGTPVAVVLLFEVAEAAVGDQYRLEYGGTTDAYSTVVWETLGLGANMVSEYRGGM